MKIDEALSDLRIIRAQLFHSEKANCYRWATIGFSGAVGFLGSLLQPIVLAGSTNVINDFVLFWILLATISIAVIGVEMVARYQRSTDHSRSQTRSALLEFLPCLVVGMVLTHTIVFDLPEHSELLPGLWAMLFGLGVSASWRRLPRSPLWIAAWYVIAGVIALKFGEPFAAWKMGLAFGVGQLLTAGLLYCYQEGQHA